MYRRTSVRSSNRCVLTTDMHNENAASASSTRSITCTSRPTRSAAWMCRPMSPTSWPRCSQPRGGGSTTFPRPLRHDCGSTAWLAAFWLVIAAARNGSGRLIARIEASHAAAPQPALGDPDGRLTRALRQVPAAEREALMLVAWEQLSYAEAAQVLGCSPNAIGIRVHRARARVREAFGEPPPGKPGPRNADASSYGRKPWTLTLCSGPRPGQPPAAARTRLGRGDQHLPADHRVSPAEAESGTHPHRRRRHLRGGGGAGGRPHAVIAARRYALGRDGDRPPEPVGQPCPGHRGADGQAGAGHGRHRRAEPPRRASSAGPVRLHEGRGRRRSRCADLALGRRIKERAYGRPGAQRDDDHSRLRRRRAPDPAARVQRQALHGAGQAEGTRPARRTRRHRAVHPAARVLPRHAHDRERDARATWRRRRESG